MTSPPIALYDWYEANHTIAEPFARMAGASARMLSAFPFARQFYATCELAYRLSKEYEKPAWDIETIFAHKREVRITEECAIALPFCRLIHFAKDVGHGRGPKVLLVAPLSGHHATLLRDTVRTLLPAHDVYVTDWIDARMVPGDQGEFGLADYVAYVQVFLRYLGVDTHVMSVCQPTVPVLAAVALLAQEPRSVTPRSMIMMGGPLDARQSPTQANRLATTKPYEWFRDNLIYKVPERYPGAGREVYPGFLQHAGFTFMNPDRHVKSHYDFYLSLLRGDDEDAQAHRRFYDEYNAVLDLPARFYLDTIRIVFQEFLLPQGRWEIDGRRVAPEAIRATALMTVEGELDDIAGLGQTHAAQELCSGIGQGRRKSLTVAGAGHYGIFSGRRWREQVYPQIEAFIQENEL